MFDWHGGLTRCERRTFLACYGGWTLDAFDAQMYALAIPALISTWGLQRSAAGSVAAASLAFSAIGGWVAGALADRFGRVQTLQITVACFSLFSLLSAFSQNIQQLCVSRAIQGFGFGGEWTVGAVLLAEIVPPLQRGKALGVLQSGWAVGWGGAVASFTVLSAILPQHLVWRALFAIGLLPALLLLYIQRFLREPGLSPARLPQPSRAPLSSMLAIFAPGALRETLLAALLGLGAHGGYYALTVWLPTYLISERHIPVIHASAYLAVIIVSFGCGCIAASQLLDRLGRRRAILLFSLGCAAMIALYLLIPINDATLFCLGAPLGFFSAGIPASMGALFSELFSSNMRGAGVGFCYNFGRIASAGLPALVGALSAFIRLGVAIGLTAIAAYSLVAVAVLALPETRGRVLQP